MRDVFPPLARAMEGEIPPSRADLLEGLAAFISSRLAQRKEAKLVFICTHNSRRSHMAHLWARAAAMHQGLHRVAAFSGGTEATAFHPNAITALVRAGFAIERLDDAPNPRYRVRCAQGDPGTVCFSKRFDDAENPRSDLAAVMVCGEADEACPVILGAGERFTVRYEDPKAADGTDMESSAYDARSRQIAGEMGFVMRRARAMLDRNDSFQ